MVDGWTGKWYPEKDYSKYPKEKWCDYDHICMAIREDGYVPKTDMENLITMIFLYFDNPDIEDYGYKRVDNNGYFNIKECIEYVKESGGWSEFDYYA